MPAATEGRLTAPLSSSLPQRVALVAGGGALPARFLEACDAKNIEVFIVAFRDQTDPALFEGRSHMLTRLGAPGHIIATLRERRFHDIVFIGSIRRPSLAELRPDLKATAFFLRNGMKVMGDDSLLRAVRRELERDGFRLHGVQAFLGDSVSISGAVGRVKPDKQAWVDINYAAHVAKSLGHLDIGQSVVIQEGMILGVEAAEGTDELVRRCAGYKRNARGPILVKAAKPQQDRDLDLPTIGPDTVTLCAAHGFAGIAVEAGHSLILDRRAVAALADKHGLFVIAGDFNAP